MIPDIHKTLSERYVAIPYEDLPDGFADNPEPVLWKLIDEYKGRVFRTSPELVKKHNDWSVRIRMDTDNTIPVKDVGVSQAGKYVQIRGMAARIGQPTPRVLEIAWVCRKCENVTRKPPSEGKPVCSCGSQNFKVDQDGSTFVDSQTVILAERFEEITGSRPPRLLSCRLDGTLIQTLNPGDRCVVGGILRILETKHGYEYELQANNVTPYREKTVEPPQLEGDILEKLAKSFAPRIYGHEMLKKSIILLLVGGSGAMGGRTNINMLLVGDPGIAKSSLLQDAADVAPLGRYTSGRGATAAGLTAGVARDKDGVMYLEAGAVVLTDGGTVCIDEFDKTAKADRTALHEVMEQQTVSITKIGTIVTLKARVSILAAANPKKSFWDDSLSLAENISLPDSLLTRFDLIYVLRDKRDADTDRKVARHILRGGSGDIMQSKEITAYLDSVRGLAPEMSEEAAAALEDYYTIERQKSVEISITARQLEAARRLAGARAKIYRRDTITADDVKHALYLLKNMIQYTLIDPETGRPDYLKATTGKSRSVMRTIDEAVSSMDGDFTAADLDVNMPFLDIERALEKLHQQGILMESKPGIYRVVR